MTDRDRLAEVTAHSSEVERQWPFSRFSPTEIAGYYHTDVPWLLVKVWCLRVEVDRLTGLLEGLTPGGSEFHDNASRCAEFARDMMNGAAKQVLLRKAAEAEVVRLTAALPDEKARLEVAVVEAALAEREANLRRHPGSDDVAHYAANAVWYKASDAFHDAVAALVASREEASDE